MMLITPKWNEISNNQKCLKMLFFDENHKFANFIEVSRHVEYSTRSQNFFLNSKHTFEHFYFLNHADLSKIEKNIDVSDPPQTAKKGGV